MRKTLLVLAALTGFAVNVLAALYIDAFVLEPSWLSVERVTIVHPGLARALGDLRIVQLSDTHFRGSPGFLHKALISEVGRLKPDIIFITGDFVSKRLGLDDFWEFVSGMKPGTFIYGVPGDDDSSLINDKWEDEGWKRAGMALLVDETLPVVWPGGGGGRVWLVAAEPYSDWAELTEKIPAGEPVIVLAHRPDTVKPAALAGADLVFVGDTHGTQIGLAPLRGFSGYTRRGPYIDGLFRVKDTILYVNRGTGWKARPIRFFCRPELTVFEFADSGDMPGLQTLPGDE